MSRIFVEPEDSQSHSQVLATCSCPEPHQSNPCLPITLCENPFTFILPPAPRSAEWSLSLSSSHENPTCISSVSHSCHSLLKSYVEERADLGYIHYKEISVQIDVLIWGLRICIEVSKELGHYTVINKEPLNSKQSIQSVCSLIVCLNSYLRGRVKRKS